MGHLRFAAKWALFRHVEQGHITVEMESRHYRNEICDQETGDPTGIFNEGDIEEYHLKATPQLWEWSRKESEKPLSNDKTEQGKGNGGKKGQGRNPKKETEELARFAQPLVAKGLGWSRDRRRVHLQTPEKGKGVCRNKA